jgi:hypothetical protein
MPSTPLHHKPIVYGNDAFDIAFLVLVALHFVPAAIAPVASIVALATKKGGAAHLRWGGWFVKSMWVVAATGIVVDVIRLSFHVDENHTKYSGYSMPSSYPARLGFLYSGFCVLWLLRETTPPNAFRVRTRSPFETRWVPAVLLALGAFLTAVIVVRFNPWTGALWMIWTFAAAVALVARGRARMTDRAGGVAHHRLGMGILAAFSWWGALQGFGPAIGILFKGADLSTSRYVGNLPGPFTPMIFFFLIPWAACFVIAALVVRRFKRAAAPKLGPAVAKDVSTSAG